MGEVCRLQLVHDDLHGSPQTYAETGGGWPWIIGSLKTVLETGEALPARDEAAMEESGGDEKALEQKAWCVVRGYLRHRLEVRGG